MQEVERVQSRTIGNGLGVGSAKFVELGFLLASAKGLGQLFPCDKWNKKESLKFLVVELCLQERGERNKRIAKMIISGVCYELVLCQALCLVFQIYYLIESL